MSHCWLYRFFRKALSLFGCYSSRTEPVSSHGADAPHTARDALKSSLQSLSSMSKNIPNGNGLSSVSEQLLAVVSQIEPTAANSKGFMDLAENIKALTPTVAASGMGSNNGPAVIADLQQRLQSMSEFLASMNDKSSVAKYNMDPTTMRNGNEEFIEIVNISGTQGSPGGNGRIGGQGGEGEGPQLEINSSTPSRYGEIAGGQGGPGGVGDDVGGKGGTGKGPVIVFSRKRASGKERLKADEV
ncbi:hypothetical protein B0H11DRAFT_2078004 [Mycena galericulata]|nr:hypothetical protein B0H11DRAFT_2078004 [Mycena galericulata]